MIGVARERDLLTIIVEEHYEGLRRKAPRTRGLLQEEFLRAFPDHDFPDIQWQTDLTVYQELAQRSTLNDGD